MTAKRGRPPGRTRYFATNQAFLRAALERLAADPTRSWNGVANEIADLIEDLRTAMQPYGSNVIYGVSKEANVRRIRRLLDDSPEGNILRIIDTGNDGKKRLRRKMP